MKNATAATACLTAICISVFVSGGCSTRVEFGPPAVSTRPDAVDINRATAEELERLPGIGRRTAEAIVEFRNNNGGYRRAEHLLLVRGVSEERFFELRPFIRAEPFQ